MIIKPNVSSSHCTFRIEKVLCLLDELYLIILVDDPLDCTAVHFGGGFWGVLATGLLTKNGVLLQMSHESLEVIHSRHTILIYIFQLLIL